MEEYKAAFEESQAENKRLRSDIKSLKEEIAQLKGVQEERRVASESKNAPVRQNVTRNAATELYLSGRVNGRGLFVRADRRPNP